MERFTEMRLVHPRAAGVDVGSKSHYVSTGQGAEEVKEFGVYSRDHLAMIAHLRRKGVTTVAMESTGSYWQSLFSALQGSGFEVLLVSGRQTQNLRAKTDVKDCQWIQRLHSLGLLSGCFLPDADTERLRVLHRHRDSLVEQSTRMSNKMQKALRMMNLRLDVVLSDITGKSGTAIIEAVLSGERSGTALAALADPRVKKSREEIASALQGHWSGEHLYELGDCYHLYGILQQKVRECDQRIAGLLDTFAVGPSPGPGKELTKKQVKGKNRPRFDLPSLSYRYYGVDLFAIEGVSMGTVLTLITEIGHGIHRFGSAKQFASFLRLAPNNRISGGKLVGRRTPKGGHRFKLALRNAANTIDRKKQGNLTAFFKRIAYRKGRGAAITATARKLAVIIWNMVVKKQEYSPMDTQLYREKIKTRAIVAIKRKMEKLKITTAQLSVT